MSKNGQEIKEKVKAAYTKAINHETSPCCTTSCEPHTQVIGYSSDELKDIPKDSVENSFGCGNPLAFADLKEGDVVLDIGSGAGIDTFIASKKVGEKGKIYGLDMTPKMIEKAKENASKAGITNVEYILGEADHIPLKEGIVDLVISNCVINLAPDKEKVFKEIYRVLKPGGKIMVSDILSEDLPEEILENDSFYSSCVAGAISEEQYLDAISKAGFKEIKIPSKSVYDEKALSMFIDSDLTKNNNASQLFDKYKDQMVGKIASAKIEAVKP